jgi:uncharacterized protein
MKKLLLISAILVFSSALKAQTERPKYVMKTYYLVFLKKGPNRSQDSATAARIQKEHLAHLDRMAEKGKLSIAGPLMDDGDIRGICIYNVPTKEEAEKLAGEDPAVKAGRLVTEIHPFYSAQGAKLD